VTDDDFEPQIDLTGPDRFTVGTVGEVGDRLFLLQCHQGTTLLTVKVEKQQVAVLAKYLAGIVRELGRPGPLPDDLAFDPAEELEPDWVVGTISVSYDDELDRLVVTIEEAMPEDEDRTVARIALTREQAAAFAIRATQLVEAGRPPCPLCGLPLDPSGHDCPRTNGHRPPVT
jgi:uncharacterized repeat protein (TIGR03847 family)